MRTWRTLGHERDLITRVDPVADGVDRVVAEEAFDSLKRKTKLAGELRTGHAVIGHIDLELRGQATFLPKRVQRAEEADVHDTGHDTALLRRYTYPSHCTPYAMGSVAFLRGC